METIVSAGNRILLSDAVMRRHKFRQELQEEKSEGPVRPQAYSVHDEIYDLEVRARASIVPMDFVSFSAGTNAEFSVQTDIMLSRVHAATTLLAWIYRYGTPWRWFRIVMNRCTEWQ